MIKIIKRFPINQTLNPFKVQPYTISYNKICILPSLRLQYNFSKIKKNKPELNLPSINISQYQ